MPRISKEAAEKRAFAMSEAKNFVFQAKSLLNSAVQTLDGAGLGSHAAKLAGYFVKLEKWQQK